MRNSSRLAGLVIGLLALAVSTTAQAQTDKSVIIIVNSTGSSWPDGNFQERLNNVVAEQNGIEIAEAEEARELLEVSGGRFNKQQAIDHGVAGAHRFVLWCDVKREDMRVEKGFALPFFAKQRRVTAQMEIEYRIVDCQRGKLVVSDKLKVRKQGPSTMQYLDFTDADPNLYLSYLERKEIFDNLEQEAADRLTDAFTELARQR